MHGVTKERRKMTPVTTSIREIQRRQNGFDERREGRRRGNARFTCSSGKRTFVNGKNRGMRGIDMRILRRDLQRMMGTDIWLDRRLRRRHSQKAKWVRTVLLHQIIQDQVETSGRETDLARIMMKNMEETLILIDTAPKTQIIRELWRG
jgi:hypothetical protein